ncbi:alpha/beta hydrolase [Ottowia sp.]|jgi:alpha-beta hydrolase superfamily lysophospholipase|uniref:alpha/beta hydrolase n=1 Tax=Ottowia sp. TaxID=1898956 RepID=UPI0025F5E15D|nr:alpha/beta hydrolase [Ottowia sp.]MBK6614861.1 alpha/beta hydrolase [Ottowia sp.]MBK6745945.1 alpha/beta hydrolase [Ottowia sp.]
MADPTLTSIASTQGDALAMHDWPVPLGAPIRGVVVVLHSVGEHAARYEDVARRLNQWGFSVRGYDQYGHGESVGVRGDLPADDRLLADLAAVIDDTRMRMDDRLPLILMGHSVGALVAARLVTLKMRRAEGLVMASPALRVNLPWVRRMLVRVLHRVAPRVRLASGLRRRYLTHDQAVVDAFRRDPLAHGLVSARLGYFVLGAGPAVLACAPRWRLPTLVLYGGQDRLIDPGGSRDFTAAAPVEWVTAHAFPLHFHELFNELEREPVFDVLHDWLVARFPPILRAFTGEPLLAGRI